MNYAFLDKKNEISIFGIVIENNLEELIIMEEKDKPTKGDIYRGRVEDIVKGLNAAFINIGEKENAFLKASDALILDEPKITTNNKIEDILKPNKDIIVQILKESVGEKGAKVSRHIELVGKYLIFTPYSPTINISRKIKGEERDRLYSIGRRIKVENRGFIIRTEAKGIDLNSLNEEYEELFKRFLELKEEENFLPTPKRLYRPFPKYYKVLKDYSEEIDEFIYNDKELENSFLKDFSFELVFKENYDIQYDINISKEYRELFYRKVFLENGNILTIDELEAMNIIDIDTGSYVGNTSRRDTILYTNIEAAKIVAKQIKLRNLSGIILIDFINMYNSQDERKLLKTLKEEFKKDYIRTDVHGISKLGFVEITRAKDGPSISKAFLKECSNCNGKGRILKV